MPINQITLPGRWRRKASGCAMATTFRADRCSKIDLSCLCRGATRYDRLGRSERAATPVYAGDLRNRPGAGSRRARRLETWRQASTSSRVALDGVWRIRWRGFDALYKTVLAQAD